MFNAVGLRLATGCQRKLEASGGKPQNFKAGPAGKIPRLPVPRPKNTLLGENRPKSRPRATAAAGPRPGTGGDRKHTPRGLRPPIFRRVRDGKLRLYLS